MHPYFAALRTYVNHLNLGWRKTQHANLLLLGTAFLARASMPVRRLARTLAGPGKAHRAFDKRLRRFLGNERLNLEGALGAHLAFVLHRLGAVPRVPVMVDWVFVGERAILWAQIPYRGRSIPLWCSVHDPSLEADEAQRTEAEKTLLKELRRAWPTWAPEPLLLMDRGFDKGSLLAWLIEQEWRFIVRIKRGHLLFDGEGRMLNDLRDAEGRLVRRGPLHPAPGQVLRFPNIRYYDKHRLPLHLVVSAVLDPKDPEGRKLLEWRLVTNLPEEELPRVPQWYARRMTPEELHRDFKRGHFVSGFALSHMGRMRRDRLERYLRLLNLIYTFLVLVAETDRTTRAWLCERHWGLSLATFALDLLRHAGSAARRLAHQACASVTLQPDWLQSGDS